MFSYKPPAESLQPHFIQQMYKVSFVCSEKSEFKLNLHQVYSLHLNVNCYDYIMCNSCIVGTDSLSALLT